MRTNFVFVTFLFVAASASSGHGNIREHPTGWRRTVEQHGTSDDDWWTRNLFCADGIQLRRAGSVTSGVED